jgi:hypothetical protein
MRRCGIVFWVEDVVRHVKPDIAFNRDRASVRPVDMVSVGALVVITNPARFKSAHVEFGACSGVDLDRLSPHGDAGEIRFVAIKLFIGGCVIA